MDIRQRELQRLFQQGDYSAGEPLFWAKLRAGDLTEDELEVLCYCGFAPAKHHWKEAISSLIPWAPRKRILTSGEPITDHQWSIEYLDKLLLPNLKLAIRANITLADAFFPLMRLGAFETPVARNKLALFKAMLRLIRGWLAGDYRSDRDWTEISIASYATNHVRPLVQQLAEQSYQLEQQQTFPWQPHQFEEQNRYLQAQNINQRQRDYLSTATLLGENMGVLEDRDPHVFKNLLHRFLNAGLGGDHLMPLGEQTPFPTSFADIKTVIESSLISYILLH